MHRISFHSHFLYVYKLALSAQSFLAIYDDHVQLQPHKHPLCTRLVNMMISAVQCHKSYYITCFTLQLVYVNNKWNHVMFMLFQYVICLNKSLSLAVVLQYNKILSVLCLNWKHQVGVVLFGRETAAVVKGLHLHLLVKICTNIKQYLSDSSHIVLPDFLVLLDKDYTYEHY